MDESGRRRSLAPQIAAGVLAVVAAAAVLSYVVPDRSAGAIRSGSSKRSDETRRVSGAKVRKGVACRPLRQVQRALRSGNAQAVNKAIAEAVHLAVMSLKKSNLAFGSPERAALKLSSEHVGSPIPASQKARISRALSSALDGCIAISS